ncbi:MAG: hypothetical protein KDD82_26580, partial [Planctomycetes bacterium]|nr:hypothetical protein [Planctomycetota bacterium]
RDVTLWRAVRDEAERRGATERLAELAEDIRASAHRVEVSADPAELLVTEAADFDLVIIGLSRQPGTPLFGHVVRAIAAQPHTALLMIARTKRRGPPPATNRMTRLQLPEE